MINMRRHSCIIIIIVSLLLSLTGCGSSKTTPTTTPTSTQPSAQTQQEQKSQQVTPQQPTQQQTETKVTTPTQQTTTPPAVTNTPSSQTQNKEVTVYVTKTGEKYHSAGCSSLSKSQIPMSLSDAKAAGYTPCSKCNPPQ